jgi:hypothetical protein
VGARGNFSSPKFFEDRRLRNWANLRYNGTLEQACEAVLTRPFVQRVGLEVIGHDEHSGELRVLFPKFDLGLTPWTGEELRCSDLGFESIWTVLRVAKGYPGAMVCGTFPDDFPANLR